MGWFNSKEKVEDKPVDTEITNPDAPAVPDRMDRLETAVANMADAVARSAQPAPAAPQQVQAPAPIEDVSDADLEAAYDNQDFRSIRVLEDKRRRADAERLRREMQGQLGQIASTGTAAINDLTTRSYLAANPYYAKDLAFKKDVDGLIAQVQKTGNILTTETLQWITSKVTGDHHERLMQTKAEADTRARREAPPTPGKRPANAPNAHPGSDDNYGLGAEAMQSLALLNKGRGRTPDEYAQELPTRRVRITEPDGNGKFRETVESYKHKTFGDVLAHRDWAEKEYERQQGIMRGELPPNTPPTPRN